MFCPISPAATCWQFPIHITGAGAEAPMDGTTATPLQYLLNQGREGPGITGLAIPPSHHQPTDMKPALTNCPTSHINGSHFFHAQEREFLFHMTSFFRIQIDIDFPHNPQAAGGSYTPPRFIILHKGPPPPQQEPPPSPPTPKNVPTPPQCQTLKTVPIDPLPLATGPTNGQRMRQYRERERGSRYPYPPPELRHRPLLSAVVDGGS